MNRSLDELTASELNDAIDDTNFPKAQSANCLSTADRTKIDDTNPQNGNSSSNNNQKNGAVDEKNENSDESKIDNDANSTATNIANGHKGFHPLKRAHPAPLKMVAFKGDSIDVPGTPRTPRTSTTPGNIKNFTFAFN